MSIKDLVASNRIWIVDIGASGGLDPRWAKFSNSVNTVLFEPDPREYENLKSNISNGKIILNSALSDQVQEVNFHLCRKQQVSSIYPPNFSFLKKFHNAKRFDVLKIIKVKTDTLDNQLEMNGINDIDFIKIDTQGYELPILQGADDSLKNVIGLELEVEFFPLYENQPLFSDVDVFARGRGFQLFDLKRCFWRRGESHDYGNRKGQIVWADALYFRIPEDIISMAGITQSKLIRAICIYLVYGYPDLAQILFELSASKGILSKEVREAIAKILKKHRDKKWVAKLRGKASLSSLFFKVANIFSKKGYYTRDEILGNYQDIQ